MASTSKALTKATLPNNDNSAGRTPSEGATLLALIVNTLKQYLVLPPMAAETMALWVLFTHTIDAWENSPFLILTSDGPESGKTTAMEFLARVCAGGTKLDSVTDAFVRRKAQEMHGKPFTMLIDEADTFFLDKPGLKPAMNAAWKREGKVGTVTQNSSKQYVTEELSLWAPYAIAGIGEKWIWPALRTRAIVFKLKRKRPDEQVEDFDRRAHPMLDKIRQFASRWASQNIESLKTSYPDLPSELQNRARDNWRPLIAIADLIGDGWPERARQISRALRQNADAVDTSVLLVKAIEVFHERLVDKIRTKDLVLALQEKGLSGIKDSMSLATHLRPLGISPSQIKFGSEGAKGYRLQGFEEAMIEHKRG